MRRRESNRHSVFKGLGFLVVLGFVAWAAAALYVDLPLQRLRVPAAIAFVLVVLLAMIFVRGYWRKIGCGFLGFLLALIWWLNLQPSNQRNWQADVARTAWAEIDGDQITIHNIRNFDYRGEFNYVPRWENRRYDLKDLRAVDLFVTYWGSEWIAHPIVSFQFGENDHVAISVETRKEVGEEYSAFLGFFRQYELVNIVGDERDLIRLRTNYRIGEEVYLYRTTASPEAAQLMFLSYLASINQLHERPAFYNAITSNCTTNIRVHSNNITGIAHAPWDWRLLLNGKGDEYAYEQGRLKSKLPFKEFKSQAHINAAARAADQSAEFSRLVREGREGFVD